ncbi:leucine--tRNA ligase [Infirmifilum lucidum]|uniref:Leucine--tRNA ligase n=1 Tax=Infirmifilum lucidum TaxID=2776706 RepID=A0A7L9FJE6_9CREN|nr:leucine--tRNA ligase [Infirmifilum lucidum]QOJ79771.1 leucine--tRNA ligase [Infirmifilum lucidum]
MASRDRFPKVDERKRDFLKSIEAKWQRRWAELGVFEADPDPRRPKFFVTFPYPYINSYPHLGTAYTVLRVDIIARFKRMKGYNVLFAQGWHATGGPIVAAALRVREGDPKQIGILKSMGISDEDVEKFKDPEYWVRFFSKGFREDFSRYGLSIDWRREFFTTYLNPPYNKFIQWQYTLLRKKGLITKGSHPVVWCPKEKKVVGDHDRPDEYAGVSPEEVVIVKFRGEDGLTYPCLTYRPETVWGAVNIWVNPDAEYVIAEVDGEKWVLGAYGAEELADQGHSVRVLGRVRGAEFVGHYALNPVTGWRVPVLPATFVAHDTGTGVVMSVPAHAPFDWVALEDLKRDPHFLDRYNVDPSILDAVQPVSLIELGGYGKYPAETVVRKYGVSYQGDRERLEEATREVYSKEFYNGILKTEVYGEKWGGKRVYEVKEDIIKYLVGLGAALRHYTLPRPVYCRCGARTHVKIVKDQWFLRYSDREWKAKAHKCIDSMVFLPAELKQEFHRLVDWYEDWACTHERELGTPLPWDEKWVLESLSDSTIYMAYYTISKYLQHPEVYGIDWEKLDNSLFDYVFLGIGDAKEVSRKLGISTELVEKMREEFLYWYPVNLRVSGKDLVPNHLVFFIMHHVAIFPPEHWPRGIAINGWINVAGEKMSKSKGNFILLREALDYWGADATRLTSAYAGNTGLDDGNFEPEFASRAVDLLYEWYTFAVENYGKGDVEWKFIDKWFESVLNRTLRYVEEEYEKLNTKNVITEGLFNLQNAFKWYLKRRGTPNRELLKRFIELQTLILAPITPHIAEEVWEKIGKGTLIVKERWPEPEAAKINDEVERAERIVQKVLQDIQELLRVIKSESIGEIAIVLPSRWKYDFLNMVNQSFREHGKVQQAIREALSKLDRRYQKEAVKLVEVIVKNTDVLDLLVSPEIEEQTLRDAIRLYEEVTGKRVRVLSEEEARGAPKARQALPARPAIIIQ